MHGLPNIGNVCWFQNLTAVQLVHLRLASQTQQALYTTSVSTVLISSFHDHDVLHGKHATTCGSQLLHVAIDEEIESRLSSNALLRTDSPTVMISYFSFKLNESIRACI